MQNNSTKYNSNNTDWIIKDWQHILKPKFDWNDLHKAFWQFPVDKNSCSIHWAITTVANSFNVDFTLEERKEIWNIALTKGADPQWWWYFADAIKLIRDYCRDNNKQRFRYYKIKNTEFEEYAKKWFMIYGWIRIKEWSTRDKLKDWYVWDDVDTFWDTKFWHAVCFWMIWDEFWFIDNYPNKTRYNEVKFRNLDKLLKKWYFFKTWYILMTDDVDEIQEWLSQRKEVKKAKKRIATTKRTKKNTA